jgi:hypothetical protein
MCLADVASPFFMITFAKPSGCWEHLHRATPSNQPDGSAESAW